MILKRYKPFSSLPISSLFDTVNKGQPLYYHIWATTENLSWNKDNAQLFKLPKLDMYIVYQ